MGTGFWQVFIAIGLTMWVEVARVTRGEVLKLREFSYIKAVKSIVKAFEEQCLKSNNLIS